MKTPPKKVTKKGKVAHKGLSVRQERFSELVAMGMTGAAAYVKAGYNVGPDVAKANACRLLTTANVKARIAELRKPQTDACLMTIEFKRMLLAEICGMPIGKLTPQSNLCAEFVTTKVSGGTRGKLKRGKKSSGNDVVDDMVIQTKVKGFDKLRAMELDSKLAGHFAPEQMVVETGPETLASIKDRVASVVSGLNLAKLRKLQSTPAQA